MIASQVALNSFLTKNKTQFVIPVYQRNYDWSHSQCKQLMQDIIEVGIKETSETHFIGSIVFIHEGIYTTSEVNPLVIIDGQQRLTTITLIYLALYKFAIANGMEEKAMEINETILINRFVKDEGSKLKLKQTDLNAKAFKFLMSNNKPSEYNEYSRVIENYSFFFKILNKENFEIFRTGLSRLLFVEISLERGKDDPQRIFESLNSTGLELSQADLIRNYILMGLEPKKQIKVFEDYWDIIENNAKDEGSLNNRVSDFIRDYMTIVNKKIPNKSKVYEEFKNKYQLRDDVFYSTTLESIKDFAKIYNKLLNPSKELDIQISKELSSIKHLEINVSYPFLIPVYSDYLSNLINKNDFLKVLNLIQSYTFRRFIVGLPTNALNKIFMTLYSDIDVNDYLQSLERSLIKKKGAQRFPSNNEIETALKDKDLYNTQSKNKLYLFEKIEHYNNRENVDITAPNITIEHIFPQTPDAKWKQQLSLIELRMFSERFLHTVGNLTLSGNNGSLGNKSFQDKKLMNKNGGEQGYIFSNLWLNRYLKEINTWSILEYNDRFSLILERFLNIWEYPKAELIFENEEQEYNIFDAPEPKNKRLEYFNFQDEVVAGEEISKMYYYVIEKLFAESPSKFLLTDIKEAIGLTKNPSELRSSYPISETYFIETNLDSNNKFRKLKLVLSVFDLEDELLIKYAN